MSAQEFFSGLVSGLLHSYGLIKDGLLKIMFGHFYCSFKKLLSFMAKSLTKKRGQGYRISGELCIDSWLKRSSTK